MKESKKRITKHFPQCFPDVTFCTMDEIKQRIEESTFKQENKDSMLELANQMRRTQSIDKALFNMEKEAFNTDKLLDRFTKIGISPIPLWENFCAKQIPGPVELLRKIADDDVIVDYTEEIYK